MPRVDDTEGNGPSEEPFDPDAENTAPDADLSGDPVDDVDDEDGLVVAAGAVSLDPEGDGE